MGAPSFARDSIQFRNEKGKRRNHCCCCACPASICPTMPTTCGRGEDCPGGEGEERRGRREGRVSYLPVLVGAPVDATVLADVELPFAVLLVNALVVTGVRQPAEQIHPILHLLRRNPFGTTPCSHQSSLLAVAIWAVIAPSHLFRHLYRLLPILFRHALHTGMSLLPLRSHGNFFLFFLFSFFSFYFACYFLLHYLVPNYLAFYQLPNDIRHKADEANSLQKNIRGGNEEGAEGGATK